MTPARAAQVDGPGAVLDQVGMVRVFGTLRLDGPTGPIRLGGPKEQLVLGMLVASRDSTVRTDALAEYLWPEGPPRSAIRTLQSYIARLRTNLSALGEGGARIVRDGHGYRFEARATVVDARLFESEWLAGHEQLLAGRSEAAATLTTAIELWVGQPFADYPDVEPCVAESRRLVEVHVIAEEDLAEARMLSGARHLVPDLEALVSTEPFRERRWRLLMIALYRDGRQRDALDAYHRARHLLADEVGVEPGPELRATEAAILAHDPTLLRSLPDDELGRGLPLALDTLGVPLVGREEALATLRATWDRTTTGRGDFIAIRGPEGIGKTHLAATFAGEAHTAGALVMHGRCDHALRGPSALVRTLLRSSGLTMAALGDAGVADEDLAESLVQFLMSREPRRPALVVLDDLHLADGATLGLIAELAGWSAATTILVLGLFGADDARPGEPDLISGTQIELRGLGRADVAAICRSYDPEGWTAQDLDLLERATGGVPLRLHEAAAELARTHASGRVAQIADAVTAARLRMNAIHGELTEGVEELQRLAARRLSVSAARAVTGAEAPPDTCPYQGLAAFDVEDAPSFFGRERLVAELASRLPGADVLVVVGPSGSGKSSVVRAGLVPALAVGVLPGSEDWAVMVLDMSTDTDRLCSLAAPPPGTRRLIVVDQLEAVFTSARGETPRRALEALVEHIDDPATTVVCTIRSDFLDGCAAHAELSERFAGAEVLVGPMTDVELRRAVALPARRAGFDLESGLEDVVLEEGRGAAGLLPLLSTALAETWERRHGRTLTIVGYRDAGGVRGAVARLADSAYDSLPGDVAPAARRLLVRLADTGGDAVDVRQRRSLDEISPTGDIATQLAVERFVERRLLTRDGRWIEVAHEALLREWPRLRSWLEDDRAGQRVRQRVVAATQSWDANGRDASELLRGSALDAALEWSAARPDDVTDRERTFLEESRAAGESELLDARQQATEQRRAKHRLALLLAAAAVLLILSLAGVAVAVVQRSRAETESARADAAALARDAQRLGAVAEVQEDVDLSLLLAAQAVELDGSAVTTGFLMDAIQRSPRVTGLYRSEGPRLLGLSLDPAGTTLAITENDGGTTLLDATTMRRLDHVDGPNALRAVRWSPHGDRLAVLGSLSFGPPFAAEVNLLDRDFAVVARLTGLTAPPASFAFSPDGRWLAATTTDDPESRAGTEVALWRTDEAGDPAARVRLDDGWARDEAEIWFGPDGDELYAPVVDGVAVLAVPSLERRSTIDGLGQGTPSPDGRTVAYSPTEGSSLTMLRDLDSGRELGPLTGHTDRILGRAFSPDGKLLATTSDDRTVKVWTADDGRLWLDLRGHAGRVLSVQFSPDGRTLFTTSLDRTVVAWDVAGDRGVIRRLDQPSSRDAQVEYRDVTPDGRFVVGVPSDEGLHVLDVHDGSTGWRSVEPGHGRAWSMVLEPDNQTVLTSDDDGALRRTDLATGRFLREVPPLSPDEFRWPLAVDATSDDVLIGSGPFQIERWDAGLDARAAAAELDAPMNGAAFDPSGERVAVVTFDPPRIEILNAHTLAPLGTSDQITDPSSVAWSPDGSVLLIGGYDGSVRRFDGSDLSMLGAPVIAHDGFVSFVDVDPDSSRFATGSTDGTVAIWDLRTGARLLVLRAGPANNNVPARFLGADELRMAYDSGEIFDVDLRPPSWLDHASAIAGRPLDETEQLEFLSTPGEQLACA